MTKTPIVLVLRSGGEYKVEHVQRLREQIPDRRFVVFTDVKVDGVETVELLHDWPGWWAKMEMFRLDEPFLFMDLDTTVKKDVEPLINVAKQHKFVALRDVYRGEKDRRALQSSLMYVDGTYGWLYDQFKQNPRFMDGGDQIFIQTRVKNAVFWQDITNEVSSYKVPTNIDPTIWVYHGKPRPWDVE